MAGFLSTNYSKIADRYDKNPIRAKEVDPEIGKLMGSKDEIKILDLACGTGNYLRKQIEYYGNKGTTWIGLDNSEEMLAYARKKNPAAVLIHGDASDSGIMVKDVDYIRNEYSFHHFTDKIKVIENIYRALKKGSVFIMVNLCPEYMKSSWLYEYFPSAQISDKAKFMSAADIYNILTKYRFKVTIEIKISLYKPDRDILISQIENRDISNLNDLSEKEYQAGLKNIKEDPLLNDKVFDFAEILDRKSVV